MLTSVLNHISNTRIRQMDSALPCKEHITQDAYNMLRVQLRRRARIVDIPGARTSLTSAHCYARGCHVLLHLIYRHLLPVEYASSQGSRCPCIGKHVREVLRTAGTAAGDDRDAHGVRDSLYQLQIKAVALPAVARLSATIVHQMRYCPSLGLPIKL